MFNDVGSNPNWIPVACTRSRWEYFKNWFANQTGDAFNFLDALQVVLLADVYICLKHYTLYYFIHYIQLLTIAIPKLEEMQRDGEDGRKKIVAITSYLTMACFN